MIAEEWHMIENHLTLQKYRGVIFCGLAMTLLYFIGRHTQTIVQVLGRCYEIEF